MTTCHTYILQLAYVVVGIQLTYKRDNFGFDRDNFPFMSSNIPAKPTYGVYISQLIRIGRICDSFSC